MSYDIYIKDEKGPIIFKKKHNYKGGTYQVGGCNEAWINITDNYSEHFVKFLGEKGIRSIYGKTVEEVVPILKEAIDKMDDEISENYWDATEGNARYSLVNLINIALLCPKTAYFEGD